MSHAIFACVATSHTLSLSAHSRAHYHLNVTSYDTIYKVYL